MSPSTSSTTPARPGRAGLLRRALGRWSGDEAQQQAEAIRRRGGSHGCVAIGEAPLRRSVRVRGTVTMVTINPRGVNRWLEAVISDGTGEVTLVFMGRRLVRGIEAGRVLEVNGPISELAGRLTVYNPNYTLLDR